MKIAHSAISYKLVALALSLYAVHIKVKPDLSGVAQTVQTDQNSLLIIRLHQGHNS